MIKAKGGLHNRLLCCVSLDVKRLNQILKNIQKTIDKLTKMWYNIYVVKGSGNLKNCGTDCPPRKIF